MARKNHYLYTTSVFMITHYRKAGDRVVAFAAAERRHNMCWFRSMPGLRTYMRMEDAVRDWERSENCRISGRRFNGEFLRLRNSWEDYRSAAGYEMKSWKRSTKRRTQYRNSGN